MKNVPIFLSLCLFFSFLSCSPISVKSDYDHEVDFTKYRTFKWMPFPKKRPKNTVKPNSILDKRIRRAVNSQLEARGYEIKATGRTDALLAYHVGVKQKIDVSRVDYGYWRGWPRHRVYAHRYKEGTLIVDLVDPELKQLVWRGWAVGAVGNFDESEKKINEAVAKILEEFPPQ